MRLTDLFKNDRQISDTDRTVQTDPAKTAEVSRQIRSMVPGQTIHGEVVSRSGSDVQIKLLDDLLMNARLDQNINIEVGRSMTFEVRNNGKSLILSPLFANMATDANTLKALDMASLPVNDTTVELTRQLMGAGLPIDRNSLQQAFREVMAFPDAEILDIVDLHRLSLPVTEDNLEQLASYKNLTHQLVGGMNDVLEALPETLQNMMQGGNVEGAAGLYQELLGMAAELQAVQSEAGALGELAEEGVLQEGILPEGAKPQNGEAVQKEGILQDKEIQPDKNLQAQTAIEDGNSSSADASLGEKLKAQMDSLAKELSGLSGQEVPEGMDASKLIALANQLLHKGVAEHDTKLLRELLGNKNLQNIMKDNLQKLWTIKPEEVADPKRVEELYRRLDRQFKGLNQILENAGQTSSEAYRATANLTQNLDFLQQVNQMYAYVQLPLRLQQGNTHGELYVYANKKNLASKDGAVSALLHLDMDHLGPVDVYVSMQSQKVNTQFYVQDDEMLDFLEAHMDLLTERLQKRGYDCNCNMQVRDESKQEENGLSKQGGIHNLLAKGGNMKLAQYAFDVRA